MRYLAWSIVVLVAATTIEALSGKYFTNSVISISVKDEDLAVRVNQTRHDAGPPPHEKAARMARYIVHYSDWAALATHCTRTPVEGFPFANAASISDGNTLSDATGIPYLYMTPLDMSAIDLEKDNRASLSMTLAQGTYCSTKGLDPEDPRCAKVILTGFMKPVKKDSSDEIFARKALFSRHPEMKEWPQDHKWFFAKLSIRSVMVLDFFGGVKHVSVEDYFKATPY